MAADSPQESSDKNTNTDAPQEASAFPLTRWTLVAQLRDGGEGSERALSELCAMYWYPVYAFVRRSGAPAADAEDLTQGFFERLLEKDVLATAEAAKGKLRSYLLATLKHFRISEFRKSTAEKRGSGVAPISIDAEVGEERFRHEPAELVDPEILFERRWASSLLDEALARIETEYVEGGRGELFDAISPFLAGQDQGDSNYAELGEPLGMNGGAVQVAVHRLRKRFRRHFEAAVAETLENPEDQDALQEELRHVLALVAA